MKIVGLTDKPWLAHAWWRIVKPFEHLRKNGIDAQHCWIDINGEPTLDINGAIVVLQRVIPRDSSAQQFIDMLRRKGAKCIVYETDDDIVSDGYIEYLKGCRRILNSHHESIIKKEIESTKQLIQLCDYVTVSTDELMNTIEDQAGHDKVEVIGSALDVEWFKSKLTNITIYNPNILIGWAGGLRPDEDFVEMAEAWKRIAKEYPQTQFVIAGYQPEILHAALPEDRIIVRPVKSIEEYPSAYQMDIGCIPLAPTKFNMCKSPIKAWEYTAARANPISNDAMYDAFWCRHRWYEGLQYLIEHRDVQWNVPDLATEYINWKEVYENISSVV